MPGFQTDHLAACYALSEVTTPASLREVLLAGMVGLARASAGLLLGRSDTGEFVRLGVLPAVLEVELPDLAEVERAQHPLAAVMATTMPLLETANGRLSEARLSLFDMPGRLLTIPVGNGSDKRADLIFLLLLPLVVGPSPADITALSEFGNHGARLNRLLLQVEMDGIARRDLSRALDHADLNRSRVLNETLPGILSGRLVGHTRVMQDLRHDIAKFGQSRLAVLITGETGTGKELVARELHRISDRAARSLVAVNIAALPADLLEAELFGHVRGAFTGATANRKGLIAEADRGTLFLDEIGEMPMPLQAKLLRVLQEKRFRPVGSDREIASDFRLICATHRDLGAAIQDGSFRGDLFYRIAPAHLTIAPLRDRIEDISPLSDHFLREIAQREGMAAKSLSIKALDLLKRQAFQGNVRELQSVIERAAIVAGEAGIIETDHLDVPIGAESPVANTPLRRLLNAAGIAGVRDRFERFLILDEYIAVEGNRREAANRLGIPLRTLNRKLQADAARDELVSLTLARSLDPALTRRIGNPPVNLKTAREEFEKQLILDAQAAAGGDRRHMAEHLRLSLSTLSEKLRRYGLATRRLPQGQSK